MKKKFSKVLILFFLIFNFNSQISANTLPSSFADLAEKLIPSVVNISTTQTITTNNNPLPLSSPFDVPKEANNTKYAIITILNITKTRGLIEILDNWDKNPNEIRQLGLKARNYFQSRRRY